MNEEKAKEILKEFIVDDGLNFSGYGDIADMEWNKTSLYNSSIILEGNFTVAQLEAIAWWMRNIDTCQQCHGLGWIAVGVCCKRAWHNCGGHGCTGSEQEQQECSDCNGTGKQSNSVPDQQEE